MVFSLGGGGGPGGPLRSMSCQNGNGRWRVGDCIHMDILAFKFQVHIMMITRLKVLKVAEPVVTKRTFYAYGFSRVA